MKCKDGTDFLEWDNPFYGREGFRHIPKRANIDLCIEFNKEREYNRIKETDKYEDFVNQRIESLKNMGRENITRNGKIVE